MELKHIGDKKRLDLAILQQQPDLSRTLIQKMIKSAQVSVNGVIIESPKHVIKDSDIINFDSILTEAREDPAQMIAFDTIFEDEYFLIINKPAGLTVHPGAGQADQTLLNAILYAYPENRQLPQAGMVHRLDKDTSGLLLIAKNISTHAKLSKMMQKRLIKKTYLALVNGRMHQPGTIEQPLARHNTNRQKFTVHPYGRPSITHYTIQERFPHHTLLKVDLETGRTHQIRVHFEHIGYPLVGDPKYGSKKALKKNNLSIETQTEISNFTRQALHAYQLEFQHPHTQDNMSIKCEIPVDLKSLLEKLRREASNPDDKLNQ